MHFDKSTRRSLTRLQRLRSYALPGLLMAGSFAGLAVATFPATPGPSVYMVKEINPTGWANPGAYTPLDGFFIFNADDGVHGQELWRSDGTYEGTYMVKDIVPGWDGSVPLPRAAMGGRVLFHCDDNINGYELWSTDGTEGGTFLVKNADPSTFGAPAGVCAGLIVMFAAAGNQFYYTVDDGVHGLEPWISDGTSEGTHLLSDLVDGSAASNALVYGAVGDTMFFSALGAGPIPGYDLWKSDGTEQGTVPLIDLAGVLDITDLGGIALFHGDDGPNGIYGEELWRSDGTPEGTVMVKDIAEGSGWSSPGNLTNVAGTLYFAAATSAHGKELWKSDGKAQGTVLVKDINPGASSSSPDWMVSVGSTLYFRADNGTHGVEVWKSDGTSEGTTLVKDINPDLYPEVSWLTPFEGRLCFSADDGISGKELWITDGTEMGTMMLADINPGPDSSWPKGMMAMDGILYFTANDGTSGNELWAYDPTPADIPAISAWGLSVMVLSLLTLGTVMVRQHRERTWV